MLVFVLKQKQLEIEEAKHKLHLIKCAGWRRPKRDRIIQNSYFFVLFPLCLFLVIVLFDKLFPKRLFKRLSFHDRYMKFTSRYVELAKSVRETEKKICCQNSTFSHLSESQILTLGKFKLISIRFWRVRIVLSVSRVNAVSKRTLDSENLLECLIEQKSKNFRSKSIDWVRLLNVSFVTLGKNI